MPGRKHNPRAKKAELTLKRAFVLEESAAGDESQLVWVQVAKSGTFKGYAGGEIEFTLDETIFSQVIKNFRSNPSYKAGADGLGAEPVLAWDFNHASEHAPTDGSLPVIGSPAQGWIYDVQARQTETGELQLWALTEWLEPAKTYVKNKQYRWASISVVFDAVDGVSGDQIGAMLTSVALTNTPFIEGMTPLAASRYYYNAAGSPDDAVRYMREMFGLGALSSVEDLGTELAKLETLVITGASLPGVEPEEMVCALRTIMGLPALTSVADVFAKSRELVSGQPEKPVSDPALTAERTFKEKTQMELIKILAQKLGVTANDDAVKDSVDELITALATLRKLFKVKDATSASALCTKITAAVEQAAEDSVELGKASDKLSQIFKAAGMDDENVNAAIEKIAGLMEDSSNLKKLMPELERMKRAAEEAEEASAEAEVDAVIASREFPAEMKFALLSLRKSDAVKFREKYPAPPADKVGLTKKISTTTTDDKNATLSKVDVTGYAGANKGQRVHSWLEQNDASFRSLSFDQKHARVWSLTASAIDNTPA